MKIEKAMTRAVYTCHPNDTLARAAQLMWDHDFGCVPVVDEANVPIAMITDRDIGMAAYLQGRSLAEIRVAEVMSRSIVTCRADQPISAAEAAMRARQVRRLPVVNESGVLVGVLSLSDLARLAHMEKTTLRRDELGPHALASTLSAICRIPGREAAE